MREYNTEILSVGTELLLGHVTNTDARDISEELSRLGINVRYHTVVGDNPQRMRDCVALARSRADIIITTGGLGPTVDDLTKVVLAESFGLKLVENQAEREQMYEYITYSNHFTENNYNQVMLPEGCTVFHNNCGTAPGCAFEADGTIVIMLPGPPKECRAMFRESVIPYLRTLSDKVIVSHSVRIFGLGESAVDDLFAAEMNSMRNPTMAPYAKECDCLLQVTAKADSEAEAEEMLRPVMAQVCEKLGDYVYGTDVECMEEAVLQLLQKNPKTFALAESCTGGEVAARFTELPGASEFLKGGAVTYTNEAKAVMLGIDRQFIESNLAVSEPVARAMAEHMRAVLNTDLAVGITGLAGPGGDGVHEVGTVFVALAAENGTWVRELHMGPQRTRSFIRRMAGNHAYDMIRRWLTGKEVAGNRSCPAF
ncbi:MAG: competence/damage-inducible protein A [Oscillospiraceae bacterium]|nr:competence/damage-inducible protein A [Oscillospiraceae bacterium]